MSDIGLQTLKTYINRLLVSKHKPIFQVKENRSILENTHTGGLNTFDIAFKREKYCQRTVTTVQSQTFNAVYAYDTKVYILLLTYHSQVHLEVLKSVFLCHCFR